MLNLPQTVTKSGISIAYIYDATGRKLRKLSTNSGITTVTEYIGGIQYQYSTVTPVLDFISTEEGRARKSGSVYKYEYDLKDHLGDTRITTTWNASDATQMTPLNSQRSDYYAFGYAIQSLQGTTPSPKNQYLYNHKELQEETGLYDYGARFYDPVIARWTAVDPLAEKGRKETPYGYAFDDPMRFTDPDGMWPDGPNDDPTHHTPPVTERLATWFGNLFSSDKQTQAEAFGDLAKNLPGQTAIAFTQKDHPSGGDLVAALLDGLSVSGLGAEAKGVSAVNRIEPQIIGVLDKSAVKVGQVARVVDDVADATGFGPKAEPIRVQGPWTKGDLARAAKGQGPVDFIPTTNKAGRRMALELHHGDQMPGSAIHEVPPAHYGSVPHPNKFNQGVTSLMRKQDSQLHWYMRGLEMFSK
jgi:RHS repeat-associated protein